MVFAPKPTIARNFFLILFSAPNSQTINLFVVVFISPDHKKSLNSFCSHTNHDESELLILFPIPNLTITSRYSKIIPKPESHTMRVSGIAFIFLLPPPKTPKHITVLEEFYSQAAPKKSPEHDMFATNFHSQIPKHSQHNHV